jgi:hypothetical protein
MSNIFTEEEMQEGVALLAAATSAIDTAFVEAEEIADKYGLEFSINPSYGMGGWYDGEEAEWYASSQSC